MFTELSCFVSIDSGLAMSEMVTQPSAFLLLRRSSNPTMRSASFITSVSVTNSTLAAPLSMRSLSSYSQRRTSLARSSSLNFVATYKHSVFVNS